MYLKKVIVWATSKLMNCICFYHYSLVRDYLGLKPVHFYSEHLITTSLSRLPSIWTRFRYWNYLNQNVIKSEKISKLNIINIQLPVYNNFLWYSFPSSVCILALQFSTSIAQTMICYEYVAFCYYVCLRKSILINIFASFL